MQVTTELADRPAISVERNNWEIEGFLYRFGYIKGKTVELDTIYY
jgi:hypothetical protein